MHIMKTEYNGPGELDRRPTLTVAEAAEILGVCERTIYRAVRAGTVPNVRYGRRIVIPTGEFLRANHLAPPPTKQLRRRRRPER